MTEITPKPTDYVFQHNVIGRAIHTLPQNVRRLVAVGMSHIKEDENMEVCFSIGDAVNALGMVKNSTSKKALRIACGMAGGQTITIDNLETEVWECYAWFRKIIIDNKADTVTMCFNEELRAYLMDFNDRFALFSPVDYGKLTGEYTQKMFDITISYRGHEGKNGNAPKCWFYEYTILELRALLSVTEGKYPRTGDLRTRVIDSSVNQINSADIGLWIKCEYNYKGKTLNSIRFNCKTVSRADLRPVTPATESEIEYNKLIQKYPEEYQKYYQEAKKQFSVFTGKTPTHEEAEEMAIKELRQAHKK